MTDAILFSHYIGVESCDFGATAKEWAVVCTFCGERYEREHSGDWRTIANHWKAKHSEELTIRRLGGFGTK